MSWLRDEQPEPARCCKQMGHVARSEAVSDLSARLGEMQAEVRQLRKDNRSKLSRSSALCIVLYL